MAATGYTHTTLGALKSIIAARLSDAGNVFWTSPEIGLAVSESLRIWNSITGAQRIRTTISTQPGVAFYDLDSAIDGSGNQVRPRTLRDVQLLSEIEYHLMESQGLSPVVPGSDQFSYAGVISAMQLRRNQFLADTASVVVSRVDSFTANDTYVQLPDSVIGIRRAVIYNPVSNRFHPLRPSDDRSASVIALSYTAGIPRTYSVAATAPLRVRLLPPPNFSGQFQSLVVSTGSNLDATANGNAGTLIGVPDDVAWAVKWGVVADMLYSSLAADEPRAALAESLFTLGVGVAKQLPVILNAEIDGRPVVPSALSLTDAFEGGWQGTAWGAPRTLSTISSDTIALTPIPDQNPHSITLDIVTNAIVPSSDSSFIQIGREQLDVISGMAQWILNFKTNIEALQQAQPMMEAFLREAQDYSYRRAAVSPLLAEMLRTTSESFSEWERPLEATGTGEGGNAVRASNPDVLSERNARRRKTP